MYSSNVFAATRHYEHVEINPFPEKRLAGRSDPQGTVPAQRLRHQLQHGVRQRHAVVRRKLFAVGSHFRAVAITMRA